MSILYELKNIEYFFDEKRVLSIDNLILEENKIIGFFGPNGSGKSTLFSILSFISKPQNGEIIIDENIKKSVVMLPQNPYLLKRTVFENIAFALEVMEAKPKEIKTKVNQVLDLVGLLHKANDLPHNLSGGEQHRVAIARAIVNRPLVLIADEPTGNLDPDTSRDIVNLFKEINNNGTTIVMVTHDMDVVRYLNKRVIRIEDGRISKEVKRGAQL